MSAEGAVKAANEAVVTSGMKLWEQNWGAHLAPSPPA
jgi:hypothetical protein